jgi:hypothetical protein
MKRKRFTIWKMIHKLRIAEQRRNWGQPIGGNCLTLDIV